MENLSRKYCISKYSQSRHFCSVHIFTRFAFVKMTFSSTLYRGSSNRNANLSPGFLKFAKMCTRENNYVHSIVNCFYLGDGLYNIKVLEIY